MAYFLLIIIVLLLITMCVVRQNDWAIKMWLVNVQVVRSYIIKTQLEKAAKYCPIVAHHVAPGARILDFGTATGAMTHVLRGPNYNFDVHPLDVVDQVLFDDVHPKLYHCDASKCRIPYDTLSFDCALVFGVLHHTHDPVHLLRELKRTCKMIILCEDVYDSTFGKYKTFVMDSIVNFEFKNHPHNNRSDAEWRVIFTHLGLNVTATYYYDYRFFRHAVYVLES